MWHDQQLMIRGHATRALMLHLVQRWIHAFTSDSHVVRSFQLPSVPPPSLLSPPPPPPLLSSPPPPPLLSSSLSSSPLLLRLSSPVKQQVISIAGDKEDKQIVVESPIRSEQQSSLPTRITTGTSFHDPADAHIYKNVTVAMIRSWPGLFDSTNLFLENFYDLIHNAQDFIYMEHQYPFQNAALTQCMIDTLKRNSKLKIIIITPVKTDLPTGVVGDLIDMSQDHIVDHLQLIYQVAPERVGIYGLVTQDKYKTSM